MHQTIWFVFVFFSSSYTFFDLDLKLFFMRKSELSWRFKTRNTFFVEYIFIETNIQSKSSVHYKNKTNTNKTG